jgi:hypothetical protein
MAAADVLTTAIGLLLDSEFALETTTPGLSSDRSTAARYLDHPYKSTSWEARLASTQVNTRIQPGDSNRPLVQTDSEAVRETVFLAQLKHAQDQCEMADSPLPMRTFFQDVNLTHANGVATFTKGGVSVPFAKSGGTNTSHLAWALFKFMRHATYGCLTGSACTAARLKAADDARKTAYLYALNLASRVVRWTPDVPNAATETNLWNSLYNSLQGTASLTVLAKKKDLLEKSLGGVLSDQSSGEDMKSKLAQASLSASTMWSSLMLARLEKFSTLSFLIIINACFFLLLNMRRASLREHRVFVAGVLGIIISIIVVRAFLGLLRQTERFTVDPAKANDLATMRWNHDLQNQVVQTQRLLNDIEVDVNNRKDVFDRKRAAMEHTYASFRFSERHSQRHVGLMQLLTVLSFVIMIVVVLQKTPVKMDKVMLMYAPVVVLGVLIAVIMQRTDQARMRTNWDKIYYGRPE